MTINMRARLVCAALALVAIPIAASDKVTVRVRLENAAGVPRRILDGAQFDASRIYRDAGIEIIWLNRDDRQCCDAGRIIRVVLPSLKGADDIPASGTRGQERIGRGQRRCRSDSHLLGSAAHLRLASGPRSRRPAGRRAGARNRTRAAARRRPFVHRHHAGRHRGQDPGCPAVHRSARRGNARASPAGARLYGWGDAGDHYSVDSARCPASSPQT